MAGPGHLTFRGGAGGAAKMVEAHCLPLTTLSGRSAQTAKYEVLVRGRVVLRYYL